MAGTRHGDHLRCAKCECWAFTFVRYSRTRDSVLVRCNKCGKEKYSRAKAAFHLAQDASPLPSSAVVKQPRRFPTSSRKHPIGGGVIHWEHGWRCHGLWQNNRRLAYIGLTPPKPGARPTYTWSLDWPRYDTANGEASSLKQAKRLVERHYFEQCGDHA